MYTLCEQVYRYMTVPSKECALRLFYDLCCTGCLVSGLFYLRIKQPGMLQPGRRAGWGRKLQQVVAVTVAVVAAVGDAADKAGETVTTGGGGANHISNTLEH